MTAIRLDELYVVHSYMKADPVVCYDDYEEAKEVCDQNNIALRKQHPHLTRNPVFISGIDEYIESYHENMCDNCDRD